MPHDVFICYSSHDKAVAYTACAALEEQGIRCWIAPRDVLPGREYGEAIISAINESRALLVVFSAKATGSPQVRREVERAVSKGKIIITLRIEEVLPSGSMEFAIGNTHWLDAIAPPLEAHLGRLITAVKAHLEIEPRLEISAERSDQTTDGKDRPALPDVRFTFYVKELDVDGFMNELHGCNPSQESNERFTIRAQGPDGMGLNPLVKEATFNGTTTQVVLSPDTRAQLGSI